MNPMPQAPMNPPNNMGMNTPNMGMNPPMQNPMPEIPQPPMNNSMADGGNVGRGNPFKDFFNDINILDITISAFIVAGVIYSISYYKFQMLKDQKGYAEISQRIATIESQIKKVNSELNATGSNKKKKPLICL
jgi:hypothetical protein